MGDDDNNDDKGRIERQVVSKVTSPLKTLISIAFPNGDPYLSRISSKEQTRINLKWRVFVKTLAIVKFNNYNHEALAVKKM